MSYHKQRQVTILGAGLAGALLARLLSQQKIQVQVYEKRPDPRLQAMAEGRSINLALSKRGWRALQAAGVGSLVKELVIPMRGRMIHSLAGETRLHPYGTTGQAIYSVSRFALNRLLIEQAEAAGAQFHFEHVCQEIKLDQNQVVLQAGEQKKLIHPDLLIGADGAFSVLRTALQKMPRFNYSQHYIEHGYKELTIPPNATGNFAMSPDALHIWPRGGFMLIALPNLDKSFTCTLFLPYQGENSFADLQSGEDVIQFFQRHFPDTLPLMPNFEEEYLRNPVADLVTIRCFPWTYNGRQVLLGDAAHAIVPFYGQGMNAAFEDCRIFSELLAEEKDSFHLVKQFQELRKPDGDAIADLALQNFVEMRDLVADDRFVERKKIEAELHRRYPHYWIPLYSMVTFSDLRYSEALQIGRKQDAIMQQVMEQFSNVAELHDDDYERIVAGLKSQGR